MAADFVVRASARSVADAIEQLARAQGNITALVVPWESTASVLTLAVTVVKSDGWAIEHTNLGTITLTDLGHAATAVAVTAHEPAHTDKLATLFDRFASQLQRRFEAAR